MLFQFIVFCFYCLTILILLWYYLYYFARISFSKQSAAHVLVNKDTSIPASIIICAKNEDHNLPEFLPLILSQDYPNYEVIVVNDCSWDNTAEVLREFEKKYSHLKVITINEDIKHSHGKKFAIMVGIKGAKNEHLLFTDGDCKPLGNQWIKYMISNFSNDTDIVLGFSKYEKLPGFLNKIIRFDTFQIALQYLSFAKAGTPYMGVGRNLAYKKSLFFKHKGFATHYHIESGDDDLFINQSATSSNTQVEFSAESFTVSRVKQNWKDWVEQKRRHITTWKEYKRMDKIRLGIYPATQFYFLLSFVTLLSFHPTIIFSELYLYFIIGLFCFKIIVQGVVFKLSMDKLKEKDLLLTSFITEIFLLFFYPIVSLTNRIYRKNKWKKT